MSLLWEHVNQDKLMSVCLEFHKIQFNGFDRMLRVFLPANYSKDKKYPVLYMHDGQNLFDSEQSYSGVSWNVGGTVTSSDKDLIVVGIDNSPKRLDEYSPWKFSSCFDVPFANGTGGYGAEYAKHVAEVIKPFIDQTYSTDQRKEATFIAGSSMGAYISVYIALEYPELFSNIGVFSLASWYNDKEFLRFIDERGIPTHQRFFIFVGGLETSDSSIPDFPTIYLTSISNFMEKLDKNDITDYVYHMIPDARHNEEAWMRIFPKFIEWLPI